MEIRIRAANPADIPQIRALIPVSVRALSEKYYTPNQIEQALQHVFGVDTQLIEDRTYFVVEHDGAIIGAGGWSKRKTLYGGDQMKTEADPLLDPANEAARIRAFYVHPAWARHGIGSRIIEACEDAARAAGFTRLELGSTLPGEPFYTARGYRVVQRTAIPFPDGDALPIALMNKVLDIE